jgi:CheY-like chemotaxis protein
MTEHHGGGFAMPNSSNCRTILCIDDDAGALEYHRVLLERRGYEVLTAASAQEGLQIAEEHAVAAVVVDYEMPEMNGHEVALEIKRRRPQVPIVMVSASDRIPEEELSVVEAFLYKDEAGTRLLPVIMQICGEIPGRISPSPK